MTFSTKDKSTLAEIRRHTKNRKTPRHKTKQIEIQKPTVSTKKPGVAAVLSFFIPGLGQIYNGQIIMGLVLLPITVLFYALVVPGLAFHIWLIYDAYKSAETYNRKLAG